jgi:Zn-dependent protease with chaperone function
LKHNNRVRSWFTLQNPTNHGKTSYPQSSWTVRALLLVLLTYNAYLCLQFITTVWAWFFTSIDARFAVLLAICDLSPPLLSLYTYTTSERKIRRWLHNRTMTDLTTQRTFYECLRTFDLENRVELWIVDCDAWNAFTFGRGESGGVVVTKGLIRGLSSDQLRGVLSHELTHVKNGDHSTMTWADSLVRVCRNFLPIYSTLSILTIALDVILNVGDPVWFSVHALTTILMVFVIPTFLVNSLSRTREYIADVTAFSVTRNYQTALWKSAANFQPLIGSGRLSLLSASSWKNRAHNLFDTHPPIPDRMKRMRIGIEPSLQTRDCVTIGIIVAISTILMLEVILSSVLYVFALAPSVFPPTQQIAMRISLALSLAKYFEATTYIVEILVPAAILFLAIPASEAVKPQRRLLVQGLAGCVGLLAAPVYFLLPEQAVTLGGFFPIPKRVWPMPPITFSSLLYAASAYFAMLCVISMVEWTIVPAVKWRTRRRS